MDVSKLFEPGEIRRLSKDETMALYKRHLMAQYERAEAAEAEVQRLTEGLRDLEAMLGGEAMSRGVGSLTIISGQEARLVRQKVRALLAVSSRPPGDTDMCEHGYVHDDAAHPAAGFERCPHGCPEASGAERRDAAGDTEGEQT